MTKAMLTTAAKTAMRGTLYAAKKAVPHLIAHKVASTIVAAAKKQKIHGEIESHINIWYIQKRLNVFQIFQKSVAVYPVT